MNRTQNLTFNEKKIDLIDYLKNTSEFSRDFALQRVVELLNNVNNIKELKKEKGLINRISIDSIKNWESINKIGFFIDNNI